MITGTFLDEISRDLPSANWGPDEWRRDFASMRADGIDTVVMSRAGCADRAAFDSKTLRKACPHVVAYDDLVALFLGLAAEHGISLWFGCHDSDEHWRAGEHRKEVDVNRALADEVWARYGRSSAFRGWYWPHAIDTRDERALLAYEEIARHLRAISGLPILAAPDLSAPPTATSKERRAHCRSALERVRGAADVVASSDAHVPPAERADHAAATVEFARASGLQSWAVVETFERGVRGEVAPIAWPKLRARMEASIAGGADKLVTFEYSHFLSPNSMHASAHMLHRRYREWLATQR